MGACGWGVYGEKKNKIKFFIRNTCRCSSEFGCLLDDDDLSLGAFIYKCKERKTTTTPETIPETKPETTPETSL
jgi:hypothetical protein